LLRLGGRPRTAVPANAERCGPTKPVEPRERDEASWRLLEHPRVLALPWLTPLATHTSLGTGGPGRGPDVGGDPGSSAGARRARALLPRARSVPRAAPAGGIR